MTNKSASGTGSIRELFKGKNILITGSSGFVGKVVLEKLMRSVPDIGGIYLLLRDSSKNQQVKDRFLSEIANSSVFDRLRRDDPDTFEQFCAERIHCVIGEVTKPFFGLQKSLFDCLAAQLDAIIHCAASVNFREELDQALQINTLCLHNIVALSRAGGNVPVLQVSTCYVNGFTRGAIHEENIAPPRKAIPRHANGFYEVDELIATLMKQIAALKSRYCGEHLSNELVELGAREARKYGWNDTYTFTKWLGEQVLLKAMQNNATLTILRPAIVESTLQEPTPGWIEGIKVADAILLAYAREKVVFFPGRRSGVIDVIPADLVANAIILSVAEQFTNPGENRIYQACSGSRNPLTLGAFIKYLMQEALENHASYDRLFRRQPRRPFVAVHKSLFQIGIALASLSLSIVEKTRRLSGRKVDSRLRNNLIVAARLATIFSFYAAPRYVFHNDKLLDLAQRMDDYDDKALFPVDPRLINWEVYLRKVHMAGVNTYGLANDQRAPLQLREQAGSTRQAA